MRDPLSLDIFPLVADAAARYGARAYVIGGYVRDWYLARPSSDIDIVLSSSPMEVARDVADRLGTNLSVFRRFGTAMLRYRNMEIEFVGARRESYSSDSRKPQVEPGTLEDDQLRRDFTVNAMAWSINSDDFGTLVDPFGGMEDLNACVLRTPADPDITFSDDPLRMFRAVRFASQLGFDIAPETFDAIVRNRDRVSILSPERIVAETEKILMSPVPSIGFTLMDQTGLLEPAFPELHRLKGVEKINGMGHKDNFLHTLKVTDNVARRDAGLYLRWAALYHDVGKPQTKSFDARTGWTFHQHEVVGSKMIPGIFRRHHMPQNEKMKYVQKLVFLHLRPIVLSETDVTDSAVRRLLFDAGDDVEDLMLLCEADITSSDRGKVQRFLRNFQLVRDKMRDLEERDRIRNFQPPVDGELIMRTYGIGPCQEIGIIKAQIKDAIINGQIRNDYGEAYALMERLAAGMGLVRPKDPESGSENR